jgi:hypothetical protein
VDIGFGRVLWSFEYDAKEAKYKDEGSFPKLKADFI